MLRSLWRRNVSVTLPSTRPCIRYRHYNVSSSKSHVTWRSHVTLRCHVPSRHIVRETSWQSSSCKFTVSEQYYGLIDRGLLREDLKQVTLLSKLDKIRSQLNSYQPPVAKSFFSRLFSSSKDSESRIQGLYVFGGVGCGKTMMMDMFYDNIDTDSKLRIHFHDFMLDVHERIHKFKSSLPPSHVRDRSCYDPIPIVARQIATESILLCFDEFQVTDVADAMILKRLFETLFAEGTVMIATGNRAPDDLYKNGLQRSNFLPFIPLLKQHCEILDMDSLVDYRIVDPKPLNIPGGQASFVRDNARVEELFCNLTGVRVSAASPRTLHFLGRELTVGVSHDTVLVTSYRELCEDNLGSSDFRALAKTYSHVLIRDFPQLSLKYKTPLRRFIIMMDLFYDRGVKLIISCDVPISQIIDLTATGQQGEDDLRLLMDDLQLTDSEARDMNLFTGEDELFSHKRALSRLHEMQCRDYWDLPHKPGRLEK